MTNKTDDTAAVEYGGLKANLEREGWSVMGVSRVTAIVAVTLALVPLQYVMTRFKNPFWWSGAGLWHRSVSRILGFEVQVSGVDRHTDATLFAVNHISWIDILVLGGHLKNASFVAKSEVAGWGAVGTLASLHKTEYVNRARRSDSARQRDKLASRVEQGHSLILFPEGTNTSGVHLAPFKSALFSVAERAGAFRDEPLMVQPVTLAYTEVNGMPLVRSQKPWVAWLGDVELFTHLRQLLNRARIVATIEFHEPISLKDAGCRKDLARYCEQEVRRGLERAHRAERRHGPAASADDETAAQSA